MTLDVARVISRSEHFVGCYGGPGVWLLLVCMMFGLDRAGCGHLYIWELRRQTHGSVR